MDTGKVVKIIKDVPAPIPVQLPEKKDNKEIVPKPVSIPEKVPAEV
jgi:hypothetical protein